MYRIVLKTFDQYTALLKTANFYNGKYYDKIFKDPLWTKKWDFFFCFLDINLNTRQFFLSLKIKVATIYREKKDQITRIITGTYWYRSFSTDILFFTSYLKISNTFYRCCWALCILPLYWDKSWPPSPCPNLAVPPYRDQGGRAASRPL